MWIVFNQAPYEDNGLVFDTYEEAKEFFDKQEADSRISICLAEVKESK